MTFDEAKHAPGEPRGIHVCDGGRPYCEQGPEYEEMMQRAFDDAPPEDIYCGEPEDYERPIDFDGELPF